MQLVKDLTCRGHQIKHGLTYGLNITHVLGQAGHRISEKLKLAVSE